MAAKTNEQLEVEVGITLNKLTKQLAQAEARMNRTATQMERDFRDANSKVVDGTSRAATMIGAKLEGVGRSVGVLLGVVIAQGLNQLAQGSRAAIKSMADLADAASRVGIDVEVFQGLQRGFGLAGVEAAAFNTSIEMFTQRIGEAADGAGPLAEILRRNGIAIKDQNGQIRPSLDLLYEFADVINSTATEAEKMALLNDAFGRSGRAMIDAFSGGTEALRQMVTGAIEGGYVLDQEIIQRAAELDDKFDDLTLKASNFFKQFAVYTGEAGLGIKMFVEDIISLYTEVGVLEERLRAAPVAMEALGVTLDNVSSLSENQMAIANDLAAGYDALAQSAFYTADMLRGVANDLDAMGKTDAANALLQVADAMNLASENFVAGNISGEQLLDTMDRMGASASGLLSALGSINGVSFDFALNSLQSLAGMLDTARQQAVALRLALPGATSGATTPAASGPAGGPVASNAAPPPSVAPSTRPQARPIDIDFGYSPSTGTGGGSPSGGGSSNPSEPAYWDELIAKVKEGEQAFADYNQTVEDGANTIADFFGSILDGSKSAQEALADLLMQLAQVQLQKAILGFGTSSDVLGTVFSAVGGSFEGGGYTGTGSRSGGVDGRGGFPAILHPNETVVDHTKGGTSGSPVTFHIDARGAQMGVAEQIEATLRRMTPTIVGQAVQATGRAMSSTKSFGRP